MTTTPTLREAAQQAMEALEAVRANMQANAPHLSGKSWGDADNAITALRAALAEQAAEQASPAYLAEPGAAQATRADLVANWPEHNRARMTVALHYSAPAAEQAEPVIPHRANLNVNGAVRRYTFCWDTGSPVETSRGAWVRHADHVAAMSAAPAAPARQEPLTEEQMLELVLPLTHDAPTLYLAMCYESGPHSITKLRSAAIALIRAIERAHGITAAPAAPARQEPLKDEQRTVIEFLLGEGPLRGAHFGDETPEGERGRFWWRNYLRAAFCPAATPITAAPAEGGAA